MSGPAKAGHYVPSFAFDRNATVGDAYVELGTAAVDLRLEAADPPPRRFLRVQPGHRDAAVHRARIQCGLRILWHLEREASIGCLETDAIVHFGHAYDDVTVDE